MHMSDTEDHLPFVTIKNDDIGPCGATINFDIENSDENCRKICKNFDELEEDEKELIRESYDFMKDILKPADEVKEELAWPFKLDAKGEPNEALKDMEKDYIKSMTSITGSARHEGFTISVLGRFPKFWRDCVLRAIRIMLITRIVAREIKYFTRLPNKQTQRLLKIIL